MTEFAGVDPHKVRLLANRLKDLADAIAKNGATIRSNFSKWQGSLDLSDLARQATQVGQDARDMSLRADEALNLLQQPNGVTLCTPGGDWVTIPWDTKDINAKQEAQQEEATLKKALANPKAPKARQTIADIAQSLADHQGDDAYMTAFMMSGGLGDTVKAARVLHDEDGTHDGAVLSKESQSILSQLAQGTQVMSTIAVQGKYPHPAPDYLSQLTNPSDGDMWSVAMLFKYGPSGDKWDPTVLSKVAGAMLDWRSKQQVMRPDYAPGTGPRSTNPMDRSERYTYFPVPDNPNDPTPPTFNNSWYSSLDLNPDYDQDGESGINQKIAAIRANDPTLAVLNSLGQNADASRDLLGNNDATSMRYARDLVDYKWQTPGPAGGDDSDAVRRILTLAATDRSAAHQDQSGQAASNILAAAAQEKGTFDGRNDQDRDEYLTYPQGTAIALAGITATWAKDIGNTGLSSNPGTNSYDSNDHLLVSNSTDTVKVMKLFAKDNPSAVAMFDVALHEQVSEAAAGTDPKDDLTALGNTAGMLTKAWGGITYTKAQQEDEEHKANLALLNTAGTLFGWVPGIPAAGDVPSFAEKAAAKSIKYSQNLVTLGRSIYAPKWDPFSTDNAGKQEATNKADAIKQLNSYSTAIAQGLIRSGQVPAPTDRPWYNAQTGTIAPGAVDNGDFQGWLSSVAKHKYQGDFENGFRHSEVSPDGK